MYMAISIEDSRALIKHSIYKSGTHKRTVSKDFEIANSEKLDPYIIRYIQSLQKKYRHNYIAYISNAHHQGLLTKCSDSAFLQAGIEKSNVKYRCIDNLWGNYITKESFLEELEFLDEITLDLFFSPFSILSSYIDEHKLVDQTTVYMLNRLDSFTIMVTKNNTHMYGTHFSMESDSDSMPDSSGYGEYEEMISEDEDMFAMDDFSLDDDLDALEDLDNLAHDEMTIGGSDEREEEDAGVSGLEIFGRDLKIYTYIKSVIDEFYESGSHDFIDKIVIFDTHSINSAIIDFIESELFLPVEVKSVDILKKTIEFSRSEVKF
jgi:hypothetical protein